VVLEVSSFQLERIEKFKPKIAVILNITDDHMDRYAQFRDYFNEKLKVFVNQDASDYLVLNHDAPELRPLKEMCRSKVVFYKKLGSAVYESRLKGAHNVENILASRTVCSIAGVSEESARATIRNFRGLAHRCEPVDTIDGVEYIDDSKGTTVDSTRRALESCGKKVVLIAGGKDKHSDYGSIRESLIRKASAVVLIGEAAGAIRSQLSGAVPMHDAEDMYSAVKKASALASAGDAVLLSPMCSSFDMFRDYKERGDIFKKAVERLRSQSRQEARA
jgi:UDP-N-acetylmuramoylalanine--D-glutamate ligase